MTEVLKEQTDGRILTNRATGDQAREIDLNHTQLGLSITVEDREFKLRVGASLGQF